jgi:predicted transcriptional regulator
MKTERPNRIKRKVRHITSAGEHGDKEKVAILENIGRGERAIAEGREISHQEAKRRLVSWLK